MRRVQQPNAGIYLISNRHRRWSRWCGLELRDTKSASRPVRVGSPASALAADVGRAAHVNRQCLRLRAKGRDDCASEARGRPMLSREENELLTRDGDGRDDAALLDP